MAGMTEREAERKEKGTHDEPETYRFSEPPFVGEMIVHTSHAASPRLLRLFRPRFAQQHLEAPNSAVGVTRAGRVRYRFRVVYWDGVSIGERGGRGGYRLASEEQAPAVFEEWESWG
jgi:hypothetical protein